MTRRILLLIVVGLAIYLAGRIGFALNQLGVLQFPYGIGPRASPPTMSPQEITIDLGTLTPGSECRGDFREVGELTTDGRPLTFTLTGDLQRFDQFWITLGVSGTFTGRWFRLSLDDPMKMITLATDTYIGLLSGRTAVA